MERQNIGAGENACQITLFNEEYIRLIKKDAGQKGCHPVQGLMEDMAFVEMYNERNLNPYQLLQIIGAQIHVSHIAGQIYSEFHLCKN